VDARLQLAAAVLVIASVPLPLVAVLIAHDGPPRKAEKVARYRGDPRPVSSTTVRNRTMDRAPTRPNARATRLHSCGSRCAEAGFGSE